MAILKYQKFANTSETKVSKELLQPSIWEVQK